MAADPKKSSLQHDARMNSVVEEIIPPVGAESD